MTTTITAGHEATIDLPEDWTVNVTPAANSAGRILRLSDDGPNGGAVIPVNAPTVGSVGPFHVPARCRVICDAGSLTYIVGPLGSAVGHVAVLTQAAYDGLTPDAATLYLITG